MFHKELEPPGSILYTGGDLTVLRVSNGVRLVEPIRAQVKTSAVTLPT